VTAGRHPIELSRMHVAIGRRMTQSKQQAPHFYVTAELDMGPLLADLDRRNRGRERAERLGMTALLVKAVAETVARHPEFNAVWNGDTLERIEAINIGIAIAVEDGLIAPALLDCGHLDAERIGANLRDLVARTRSGRLRAAELSDATITLSNLGMFNVTQFTAIIAPPQIAILATGRIEPRAVVEDGEVVVRQRMTATLSADHRALDGAAAGRFFETLASTLAAPEVWTAGDASRPADGDEASGSAAAIRA
jgi:pyruvate dehydrogenase E2 component (dihydrolipoamide acetyltransferase)